MPQPSTVTVWEIKACPGSYPVLHSLPIILCIFALTPRDITGWGWSLTLLSSIWNPGFCTLIVALRLIHLSSLCWKQKYNYSFCIVTRRDSTLKMLNILCSDMEANTFLIPASVSFGLIFIYENSSCNNGARNYISHMPKQSGYVFISEAHVLG